MVMSQQKAQQASDQHTTEQAEGNAPVTEGPRAPEQARQQQERNPDQVVEREAQGADAQRYSKVVYFKPAEGQTFKVRYQYTGGDNKPQIGQFSDLGNNAGIGAPNVGTLTKAGEGVFSLKVDKKLEAPIVLKMSEVKDKQVHDRIYRIEPGKPNASLEAVELTSVTDFSKQVLEASKDKPILVQFGAIWCPPCRQQKPETLEASVRAGAGSPAYVDVDQHEALAEEYKIESIPVTAVIKDGEIVERLDGFQPQSTMIEALKKHQSETK